MLFPAMPTPIRCPNCGHNYIVELRSVIDIAANPDLKEQLLRGQVNYAHCPQCGAGGMLGTPLVYHDPSKELLISFVPPELGLSAEEQERYIGSLVQAIINSLPAEARKAYLLQPKTALTLDSLLDTILEADGISKEVLEAQRVRLRLITQLESAVDDEETFDKLVEEHRAELDYTFFLILSSLIDAQREGGEEESERVASLQELREKLLERVRPAMPQAAPAGASYDELIELLQNTGEGDVWRQTIALNRARLDYGFFQALTARITSAEGAGDTTTAQKLTELRKRILDELDALDRLVREAEDRISLLIMRLSEATDLRAAIAKHLDEIDDLFFVVLGRYIATAQSQGDTERVTKLRAILEATTEALEERLPPDLRLINRLARAESEEAANKVLEAHRGLLTDEFLQQYDRYLEELDSEQDADLFAKLKKIRGQIVAKMTILRG